MRTNVKVYQDWLYSLAVTEWGCTNRQARHIAYSKVSE